MREGWSLATLAEVVDPDRPITYGIVQPGPHQTDGVPLIRGKDYSSGRVRSEALYRVGEDVARSYRRSTVRGGDILLSIVGYLGQTAVVPETLAGANITQTTARIAIRSPHDAQFFFQQFQTPRFRSEIDRYRKGSAQPGLNLADVARMTVVVPPVDEQRRIAAVLAAIDHAILSQQAVATCAAETRTRLVETMAATGRPIRLGEALEGIDAGWSPQCEQTPARDGQWGVLKVSAVTWGRFNPAENKALPASLQPRPGITVRAGDVLLSRANTPDLVGRSVLARSHHPTLMMSDKLLRLRPNTTMLDSRFLNAALGSRAVREAISNAATGSSRSMKNISQAALLDLEIPVPPLDEQVRLAEALDAVEVVEDRESLVATHLAEVKRATARRLFGSEV